MKADVNEGRKVLLTPEVMLKRKSARTRDDPHDSRVPIQKTLSTEQVKTSLPQSFRSRVIRHGVTEFGYVRIFSFGTYNVDGFVKEFIRLVKELPQRGLVIDVRNNGGGKIAAGERLLQLLTPRPIKPESFQLLNTPLNLDLTRLDPELWQWRESIEESFVTGAIYSLRLSF